MRFRYPSPRWELLRGVAEISGLTGRHSSLSARRRGAVAVASEQCELIQFQYLFVPGYNGKEVQRLLATADSFHFEFDRCNTK